MGLNKQKQVGTKVPAIRFDGFRDEWDRVRLDSVFIDGFSGGTPRVGVKSYYDGDIPFLAISDINGRNLDHIEKSITDDGLNNSSAQMVPVGSISLAMYASVGKVAISTTDMATSQAFYNMVFDDLSYRDFIYSLLDKMDRFNGWRALVSEGTQKNLNAGKVKSLKVNIPTSKESGMIGDFFKTIDDLISVEIELLENYEQYKEAMLQKMFPKKGEVVPEVRFDGFTDVWMETKLGVMLDYEQPTKYLVDSDVYSDEFDTPVLTAGKSFLLGYTDETNGIYDKGNVILFDDFTTAFHHIEFPFKVKSSATKFLTTTSDDYNLRFIYESMKGIQYPTDSHKRYWISEYTSLSRMVPSISEQTFIGDFFKTIDDLIRAKSNRVDELTQMKESFLQNMFI